MPLRHRGLVDLPAPARDGGFDHAAVREPTGRIYVARNLVCAFLPASHRAAVYHDAGSRRP